MTMIVDGHDRDGGAAFPRATQSPAPTQCGMSLRDYFAGQALVGLLAQRDTALDSDFADIAKDAYIFAESMLWERKEV
jgi:hypothetical protein